MDTPKNRIATAVNVFDGAGIMRLVVKQPGHCTLIYTPCPNKNGPTDFFAVTFTNIDRFS